jgi:hypothetical protein
MFLSIHWEVTRSQSPFDCEESFALKCTLKCICLGEVEEIESFAGLGLFTERPPILLSTKKLNFINTNEAFCKVARYFCLRWLMSTV